MPDPWRAWANPLSTSPAYARVTVVRETPRATLRSRSLGSRRSSPTRPSPISSRSSSASPAYAGAAVEAADERGQARCSNGSHHAVHSLTSGYLWGVQSGGPWIRDHHRPPPRIALSDLGPIAQLRAGRLGRRLVQLYAGLLLYGFSIALMVRSDLGLAPWDVLHSGLTKWFPIDIGQALVLVSFVVMLAWIPLREMPGVGTISNAIVIGLSTDLFLAVLAAPGRARAAGRAAGVGRRAAGRRHRGVHRRPARPRPARRADDRAGPAHRPVAAPGADADGARRRGAGPAARRRRRARHDRLRAVHRPAQPGAAAVLPGAVAEEGEFQADQFGGTEALGRRYRAGTGGPWARRVSRCRSRHNRPPPGRSATSRSSATSAWSV